MNEELKVIISAEVSKLKQNVEKAKENVKSFQDQVKKAKEKVDENFAAMGSAISSGIKTAATSLAALGAALIGLGASTEEYRQQQAQLMTAFQSAGATAREAWVAYEGLYRVLGDSGQATEAAQHLAKLTTEEKALSQWTTICQGVYGTFSGSLPIEGLTEAANETAKVGQLTGVLADALNWAGVNEEAFQEQLDKCNDEAEREALIRQTLLGLYSEASVRYEQQNAEILAQREAQAYLNDQLANLGYTMAPVITAFTEFGALLMEILMPVIAEVTNAVIPKLQEALNKTASIIETVFYWMVDHADLLKVLGAIVLTLVTSIGLYNAVAAVKAAMAALEVTSVWGLVSAYTAQAAAMLIAIAPYVAIVAAIAAVIAIIVTCIKHWDKIKETVSNAVSSIWNNISDSFGRIGDKINNTMENVKQKIRDSIDKIKALFSFEWSLPKPKFPSFSISGGEAPWGFMGQGSLPKIAIKWNALGGVFDKPTVMGYDGSLQGIGENGAEMVAPLENNLEWLDKLAAMLNERMGTNQPIVLNVDGKVFAQTAISTINQQTRQTGKLALNLV